jgi:hypothetical protein
LQEYCTRATPQSFFGYKGSIFAGVSSTGHLRGFKPAQLHEFRSGGTAVRLKFECEGAAIRCSPLQSAATRRQ